MSALVELSDQQKDVVRFPLQPISVMACAGSGKTKTAVHRLACMREKLKDKHGLIALLSFSNVAVDTFRQEYRQLQRMRPIYSSRSEVEISTMDGFITSNILRPHSHRTMKCNCTPFLVDGREPFLKNFTIFDGNISHPTTDLKFMFYAEKPTFSVGRRTDIAVSEYRAVAAIEKLAIHGAHTHASANYWVLRTLQEQPAILRALVRRYPHILVDEAQDIGSMHEAILNQLCDAGVHLSLIGDDAQGIYGFSGANGKFLSRYKDKVGVTHKTLDTNFRSVPDILSVANSLSGRNDKPDRKAPEILNGAYYISYKKGEEQLAIATFNSMLKTAKVSQTDGVVLCRSAELMRQWSGGDNPQGQGLVKLFAEAAICRDQLLRFADAFEAAAVAIIGLLDEKHSELLSELLRPTKTSATRKLRRDIWGFMRDPLTGLPSSSLVADTEWHPELVKRTKLFIEHLEASFDLAPGKNLGQKLAKKRIENRPLCQQLDLAQPDSFDFRVSTVHKVKGESLDGVMYAVTKKHAEELLEGTKTEAGRIGYVALTRARNLFVLAVPDAAVNALAPRLQAVGFRTTK